MNPETSDWFTIFKIIFECTSAYSTIGLSLGTPNNNWSFCGEFGTASKLVVRLYSFSSLLSLPSIHPLILSADLLHWS
jgi:Trk-type K+ transport system membrane component